MAFLGPCSPLRGESRPEGGGGGQASSRDNGLTPSASLRSAPPPGVNSRAELRHSALRDSSPPLLGEVAADHREADGGGYKAVWGTEAKPPS